MSDHFPATSLAQRNPNHVRTRQFQRPALQELRYCYCYGVRRTYAPAGRGWPQPFAPVGVHDKEIRMFSILGWMIFGLVVGAIAKLLMPGRDPGGMLITMVLGIVGAVLGGYIGRALGLYGPNDAAGFFMALIGSLVLLGLYRMSIKRPA
jgi:uncharacterized membrane protein YeaQ/YmgE (transglycosylase-associated protein family)